MHWWNHSIRVAWGPRRETVDECVERLEKCLEGLAACDEVFERWSFYGPGERCCPMTKDALRQRLVEFSEIEDFSEDLGYMVGLHGGPSDDDWIKLSATCSLYTETPGLVNNCLLFLPRKGAVARRILHWEILGRALGAIAAAWAADWGNVTDSEFHSQRFIFPEIPYVAWMNYFSKRRGSIPVLPEAYPVLPVEESGSVVVATQEIFRHDNPLHVQAAEGLSGILDRAGLLEPMEKGAS